MRSEEATSEMIAHFREYAFFSEAYGSPFSAQLSECMLDDIQAGGPVADLVADWPGPPRADALAVRLAGALHAAVLTGRDPALADQYPASRPDWSMDRVWPLARALFERERSWVTDFIRSPPQTNEVRRSIALLLGFLTLAREYDGPMDTLELGASAGLNLNWDRFHYHTDSWSYGEPSPVELDTAWKGPAPPVHSVPHVRSRAGCDLRPLDVGDPQQRLRLRSYVWADQLERMERFDAAADLAVALGAKVDRADAGAWLRGKLAARPGDGLTVVYHSVFLQYPPRDERQAIIDGIEAAGARATKSAPLAWLRLEHEALFGGPHRSPRFLLELVTWPGAERRTLAVTDGHARAVEAL
jgi:hypothetical protein